MMRASSSRWVAAGAALLAALGLLSRDARAAGDPEAARLADGHSVKWNWQPPGQDDRYGHSEVLVHAPYEAVRRQVLDYAHYKDLVPEKFHNARVVGKEGDAAQKATDLYMQVPIMHGLITLWNVIRFVEVPALAPGWTMVEGWLVKGNVKRTNLAWTVHKVDDAFTLVKLDLLILPTLPAPQGAIDEELRDAAMDAINAVQGRSQAGNPWVPYPLTGAALTVPVGAPAGAVVP